METELKNLDVFVGCGRIAHFTVQDVCLVSLEFKNSQNGVTPMEINHPNLIVKALSEFKKVNTNFKPKCLLYQGADFVVYEFERIL